MLRSEFTVKFGRTQQEKATDLAGLPCVNATSF